MYIVYILQLRTNQGSPLEQFKTVSEQFKVRHDIKIITESVSYNKWKCPMQIKIHDFLNLLFHNFFFNVKTKFLF